MDVAAMFLLACFYSIVPALALAAALEGCMEFGFCKDQGEGNKKHFIWVLLFIPIYWLAILFGLSEAKDTAPPSAK